MHTPIDYDRVAWFYDRTAAIIFGNVLSGAEKTFLDNIQPASRVLIAGGGTGKILEDLARKFPGGLKIHYVERSLKMLNQAKERAYGLNTVIFTHSAIEDMTIDTYDCILTSFLFDNFDERSASTVFRQLDRQLSSSGYWINTEFQLSGPYWQKILLKGMYLFFSLFFQLKTSSLPPLPELFDKYGYALRKEATFYGHFIASRLYQKE